LSWSSSSPRVVVVVFAVASSFFGFGRSSAFRCAPRCIAQEALHRSLAPCHSSLLLVVHLQCLLVRVACSLLPFDVRFSSLLSLDLTIRLDPSSCFGSLRLCPRCARFSVSFHQFASSFLCLVLALSCAFVSLAFAFTPRDFVFLSLFVPGWQWSTLCLAARTAC